MSWIIRIRNLSALKDLDHEAGINYLSEVWKRLRKFARVCSVGYTSTRGIFGGRTEATEVSGTGIEFVPNLTGVFGRVLRPYRTLPKTSVGYLPQKYPRHTLVQP